MTDRKDILIAGNDGENRKLLGEPLSDAYDIIEAEDGKQVLAEIQKRRNELAAEERTGGGTSGLGPSSGQCLSDSTGNAVQRNDGADPGVHHHCGA